MSRRKRRSVLTALAAASALALGTTFPFFAAERSTEGSVPAADGILSESSGVTVTFTLTEPFTSILTDSLEFDMSWLDTVSIGCEKVDDQSIAISLDLNGTSLAEGSFSYNEETQTLYLLCPELRSEAMAIDFRKLMSSQAELSGFSIQDLISKAGQLSSLLTEEAEDLIGSISGEELAECFSRYKEILMSSFEVDAVTFVPVTAGGKTEIVSVMTLRENSEELGPALDALLGALADDELLEKILTSDLAKSLYSLISPSSEDGSMLKATQSLLTSARNLVSSSASLLPGFYLSVGTGEEGDFRSLSSGFEVDGSRSDLFDLVNLSSGPDILFELRAGALPASLLRLDSSEKTALSITGAKEEDVFIGKVELTVGGESLGSLVFSDADLEILSFGQLLLTVSAKEGSSAVTSEINPAMAIPVNDEAALQAYLEGSDLDGIAGKWAQISGNMMADTS